MSYIKDIVEKVLPVGIGEEFNIILDDGRYCMYNPFKFTETDLIDTHGGVFTAYIGRIITQEYKIEKIPFKPKIGENHWSYDDELKPCQYTWTGHPFDYIDKMLGLVFRTKEEAENYLPTFKERLKAQGWVEK